MPAPTVQEKALTDVAASKKDGTETTMKPEDNRTAKEVATANAEVHRDKITSDPTFNDMTSGETKVDGDLTERMLPGEEKQMPEVHSSSSPIKDEQLAAESTASKDDKKVGPPAKESNVAKGVVHGKTETDAKGTGVGNLSNETSKIPEQAPESKQGHNTMAMDRPTAVDRENEDVSEEPDTSVQLVNVKKTGTGDKTAQPKEQVKDNQNDNDERPKVTFSSVVDVANEENDSEYNPSEDRDAEDEEEEQEEEEQEEDGEIDEGDGPMMDLQGLPQLLTASLLEKGAMSGPLHALASKGNTDELSALLAKGGDMEGKVDDSDIYRYTALHVACENDKLEVCKLLLEQGADIEASTKMHESKPIHYAAVEGHDEIIAFLLQKGANINALTDDNRTPLYQAAMRGHDHCVKLLLDNGANRNLAGKDGKKPHDVAEKRKIIDLLISPPAKKVRTQ